MKIKILLFIFLFFFPFLVQGHLNVLLRDLFNPKGWTVLVPDLRIISTLIVWGVANIFSIWCFRLKKITEKFLRIYLCVSFIYCVIVAVLIYLAVTD